MELRLDTEDQKNQAVRAMALALVDNHYGTIRPGCDAATVLQSFLVELAELEHGGERLTIEERLTNAAQAFTEMARRARSHGRYTVNDTKTARVYLGDATLSDYKALVQAAFDPFGKPIMPQPEWGQEAAMLGALIDFLRETLAEKDERIAELEAEVATAYHDAQLDGAIDRLHRLAEGGTANG